MKNGIGDIFSFIMAASKDKVYQETVRKMQEAFHELIITEADGRRKKTNNLIKSMAKLDVEIIRFKKEYARISNQLSTETRADINQFLNMMEEKRKEYAFEKKKYKSVGGKR